MKKKIIISLIIVAVLLAGIVGVWAYKTGKFAGLADQIEQTQLGPGVHIQVKFKNGNPAINYSVRFQRKNESEPIIIVAPTKTDAQGYVHFSPREYANDYQVMVTYYADASVHPCDYWDPNKYYTVAQPSAFIAVTLPCGDDSSPSPLPIEKASLNGYVFNDSDPAKARIEGASVNVYDWIQNRIANTTTNSNGEFEFKSISLTKSPYTLRVFKGGFNSWSGGINLQPGNNTANVGLTETEQLPPKDKFDLTGAIKDAKNGELIPDAKIQLSWTKSAVTYFKEDKSYESVDPRYNYSVTRIPIYDSLDPNAIPYDVKITHPDCDDYSSRIVVDPSRLTYIAGREDEAYYQDESFSLSCREKAAISGYITDSSDPSLVIKGAKVMLAIENEAQDPIEVFRAESNQNGFYILDNVPYYPQYNYHFVVREPNYNNLQIISKLPPPKEGVIEQNFSLDPASGIVYGRVIDKETKKPISGATVYFGPSQGGGKSIGSITDDRQSSGYPDYKTDSRGYYLMTGVPIGGHVIVAEAPGYKLEGNSQDVKIEKGKKVKASFQLVEGMSGAGVIYGRVINGYYSKFSCPFNYYNLYLPNQKVELYSLDETPTKKEEELVGIKITDSKGSFYFQDLLPGKYLLRIDNEYYHGEIRRAIGYSFKLVDVELIVKNRKNVPSRVINRNGFEIEFYGPEAQKYIDKYQWNEQTQQMKKVLDEVYYNVPNPKILIVDGEIDRWAAFADGPCNIIVMDTAFLSGSSGDELTDLIIHELGHIIQYNATSLILENILKNNFRAAEETSGCPFEVVAGNTIMEGADHCADNDHEYFAYFTEAYFLHRGALLQGIKDASPECQNVLAHMWELYTYEVGSVRDGDRGIFPPYDKKMKLISKENIINGSWWDKKDRTLSEKISDAALNLKEEVLFRASPSINQTILTKDKVASSLEKLIFWKGKGSVNLSVYYSIDNQLVPAKGAIVSLGTGCIVDDSGQCNINNLPIGNKNIKIYEPNKFYTYHLATLDDEEVKTVNVEKDKTTELILLIN